MKILRARLYELGELELKMKDLKIERIRLEQVIDQKE